MKAMSNKTIPIIDLFAGPGGLGEGFMRLRKSNKRVFNIALSIEKDPQAHKTLMLRSIFRKFDDGKAPSCYYEYISGKITKDEFLKNSLIKDCAKEALNEAKNVALGEIASSQVDTWISQRIQRNKKWVLIGGPPCQAYSLAGRSKMINLDKDKYEADHRHLLYKEYLRIIEKHSPPIFIMENVKGILSSKFNNQLIFNQILSDLKNPKKGLEYEIRSLVVEGSNEELLPSDYIIKSELFGIPQARHRVILFGVRKDLAKKKHHTLKTTSKLSVGQALSGLPEIRSKLSKEHDSHENWIKCLGRTQTLLSGLNQKDKSIIQDVLKHNLDLANFCTSTGSEFISGNFYKHMQQSEFKTWIQDSRLPGISHHTARGHIQSDIQRYFFLSSHVEAFGHQPKVTDLPKKLLPSHKNIHSKNTPFTDRFRVQNSSENSTTIVSHISKDGHYYIHPSPWQARSLTVREAARLQTFPDNYFFEGTRTEQYTQVGNAVPPMLAYKIAEIVSDFLQ